MKIATIRSLSVHNLPLMFLALPSLALLFSSSQLCCQTHIGGWINGTLTREGNPYHADDGSNGFGVRNGDTLLIEPGVIILIPWRGIIIVEGVLLALGANEDSIYFDRLGNRNWIGIIFMDTLRSQQCSMFQFCIFNNMSPPNEFANEPPAISISEYYDSIRFDWCMFSNFRVGVSTIRAQVARISNCQFVNMTGISGFAFSPGFNNTFIESSIFNRVIIGIATGGGFMLQGCLFLECDRAVSYVVYDPVELPLVVRNCIFVLGNPTLSINCIVLSTCLQSSSFWSRDKSFCWGAAV
ncbi:MAG: hypothetical protein FJY67_03010 [Calditrichaeota bacterium]|nr:hypothetical protein [Calditrichota bacterium]